MYVKLSIFLLLALFAWSDAHGMGDIMRKHHRRGFDCDFEKQESYTKCSRLIRITPIESMDKAQVENIKKSCISNRSELVDMLFKKSYCKGGRYSPYPYFLFTRKLEKLSMKFDRFLVKVEPQEGNIVNELDEITQDDYETEDIDINQEENELGIEDGQDEFIMREEMVGRRGDRRRHHSDSDESNHGRRGPCRRGPCNRRHKKFFPKEIMLTLDEATQCFLEQVVPDLISNNTLNLEAVKQWLIANNDEADVSNTVLTNSVDACSQRVNGYLVAPIRRCIIDECVDRISTEIIQ